MSTLLSPLVFTTSTQVQPGAIQSPSETFLVITCQRQRSISQLPAPSFWQSHSLGSMGDLFDLPQDLYPALGLHRLGLASNEGVSSVPFLRQSMQWGQLYLLYFPFIVVLVAIIFVSHENSILDFSIDLSFMKSCMFLKSLLQIKSHFDFPSISLFIVAKL